MPNILVKYYNFRMLMTVDLNMLVKVLLETYGDNINIGFELMNSSEQSLSSKMENEFGIVEVIERFWVIECEKTGELIRRKDLEEKIVKYGVK